MSTKYKSVQMYMWGKSRIGAIPFMRALKKAEKYHRDNPVEDLSSETAKMPTGERRQERVEVNTRDMLDVVQKRHRESTMMPFLRENVPYSIAGEIVDKLVLGA